MFFTVSVSFVLILLSIIINLNLNNSFLKMKEYFGSNFSYSTFKFLYATDESLEGFCPGEIENVKSEY